MIIVAGCKPERKNNDDGWTEIYLCMCLLRNSPVRYADWCAHLNQNDWCSYNYPHLFVNCRVATKEKKNWNSSISNSVRLVCDASFIFRGKQKIYEFRMSPYSSCFEKRAKKVFNLAIKTHLIIQLCGQSWKENIKFTPAANGLNNCALIKWFIYYGHSEDHIWAEKEVLQQLKEEATKKLNLICIVMFIKGIRTMCNTNIIIFFNSV